MSLWSVERGPHLPWLRRSSIAKPQKREKETKCRKACRKPQIGVGLIDRSDEWTPLCPFDKRTELLGPAGDVQLRSGCSSHCRRDGGRGEGSCAAWGLFMRNEGRRFRDRLSAQSFRTLGRWTATRWNWLVASKKKRHQSSCIKSFSLL